MKEIVFTLCALQNIMNGMENLRVKIQSRL